MLAVKRAIASICFILVFLVAFTEVSGILERKSLSGAWNMSVKVNGFYNEPQNTFDILFFGSSHMYCSIDPNVLENETGLKSYVLATQKQPIWVSYHYIKEALKTQNPKLLVLEVNMMVQEDEYADEGTLYSAFDPIAFSRNKIDMVFSAVKPGERRFYLFNIYKYHNRWEELELEDYTQDYLKEKDSNKGYVRLEQITPIPYRDNLLDIKAVGSPLKKSIEYLEKIIALAEEKGIRLILMKTPSNASIEEQKKYNAAWEIADRHKIEYLDYNLLYKEVDLDINIDFYDKRHLNYSGMKKLVRHFSNYLNSAE